MNKDSASYSNSFLTSIKLSFQFNGYSQYKLLNGRSLLHGIHHSNLLFRVGVYHGQRASLCANYYNWYTATNDKRLSTAVYGMKLLPGLWEFLYFANSSNSMWIILYIPYMNLQWII